VTTKIRRLVRCAAVIAVVMSVGYGLSLHAQLPQPVATWSSIGPTPYGRADAAAVTLADGRTLIVGGTLADGSVTDSVIAFDPTTNTVLNVGHLLSPLVGHTATLLADGRVVVVGGSIANVVSPDIEVFDPATGTSMLRRATDATPHTSCRRTAQGWPRARRRWTRARIGS